MQQSWSQLLFCHWPLKKEDLRSHIPSILEIDTYEGEAWIGVVPFAMRHVHPRLMCDVPWLSNFLELNVRTYVIKNGIPGVYFFSLDCSNPVAVTLARSTFHLPYFNAAMKLTANGAEISYSSQRRNSARFDAKYAPAGPTYKSTPDSLDSFLTERYCLYTTDRQGTCYRGNIHHEQWPLQAATAEIRVNELVSEQLQLVLPDVAPLLHYVENIDTVEWILARV